MGAEKGGTKSGSFFHLFDLNRKSRKKLFSSKTVVSPEISKHEKRPDSTLPSMPLHLDDEDEIVGVSSVRENSDYSCASSVTDEGFSSRPPGVVARLMGLDSMPISGASEPCSTLYFDSRFLHEKKSNKRSPDFCINDQFNNISHRTESYLRKPMELMSQRMPSSPIERFQTETIPPRSAKSLPLAHHKLLSPMKNPGLVSGNNAARIMEAAAKILDQGSQPSARGKVYSFRSPSIPLNVCDSKESMLATHSQRTTRILESARTPAESTDVRYLRGQGQSLNRCQNGPEDSLIYRRSPDFTGVGSADAKNKGKSISLAIQAKVNVQRRESLSSSGMKTPIQKDHEVCKVNQSFRNQSNHQKNKQQRKPATTSASGVLRQNNQKQNCLSSRSKQSSKQWVTNQNGRKVVSGGDASSAKNKTVNRLSGNSRVIMRGSSVPANLETDELSSTNKDFPRKKRLIERSFLSEKGGSLDNVTRDGYQKHVQPNVVIDEHSYLRWAEDSRSNGADVVSFTFTSPLRKPTPIMESSIQVVEKWDKRNTVFYDAHNHKDDTDVKDRKASSRGLNIVTGDALSVILEQKLRELTSGIGSPNGSFPEAESFIASSSVTQEMLSDFDAQSSSTAESRRNLVHKPCRDNLAGAFHPGVSSTNGLVFGLSKIQRIEEVECSSNSDARKETDLQNLSPLSTLESSFSNGSFISSDSSAGDKGCRISSSSSIQAKNITSLNSANKNTSPEIEMELLDSASSTLTEAPDTSEHSRRRRRANGDLDYVRELSSLWAPVYSETLAPLVFDKLEDGRTDDKDGKMGRKVLFDCVNECLDSKCNRYFRAGYKLWSNGAGRMGSNMAEELYKEIMVWKSMGDWTADELVDKDMSTHRGKWLDFEFEAFEAGRDIENDIVNSLVDEMVDEYFIRCPLK